MRHRTTWWLFFGSLLLAGFIVAGMAMASHGQHSRPYRQFGVYAEVLSYIQRDYVTKPNMHAVANGSLHGLLDSLDAGSSYLTTRQYRAYRAALAQPDPQGSTGLVVSKRGEAIIVDVVPGSPADTAGLHRGDLLELIAGQHTERLSLFEIRHLLVGAPGTSVQVRVIFMRHVQPKTLNLQRVLLPHRPILAQLLENHIAYLRLPDLGKGRARALAAHLAALTRQGANQLVLDLRGCGDGSYHTAEAAANLFLKQGVITSLSGRTMPQQLVEAQPQRVRWPSLPMAVLVNAGTAGPGEVLAAAILDNHRGNVVGDKTFGEGAVQKLFPLGDGTAVLLTVAKYYTPAHQAIEDTAITPNIEQVRYPGALPDDDVSPLGVLPPKQDLQLNRALQTLGAKPLPRALAAPA